MEVEKLQKGKTTIVLPPPYDLENIQAWMHSQVYPYLNFKNPVLYILFRTAVEQI